MGIGLGGAQVNGDLAMRLHRQQMELHAGQLSPTAQY
jgi:hypothetical protein